MWDGMTLDKFQAKLDEANDRMEALHKEADRCRMEADSFRYRARAIQRAIEKEVSAWKAAGKEWYT